ncbi:hypothetical protein DIPPA_01150 [Diplonema papillatum]|nr:hypothetical protein DIPPA_01150 [Diplonema papillatum]
MPRMVRAAGAHVLKLPCGTSGVLGADFLGGFGAVAFRWSLRHLSFLHGSPASPIAEAERFANESSEVASGPLARVSIANRFKGLVTITVVLNGPSGCVEAAAIVDTGCPFTVVLPWLAQKLGVVVGASSVSGSWFTSAARDSAFRTQQRGASATDRKPPLPEEPATTKLQPPPLSPVQPTARPVPGAPARAGTPVCIEPPLGVSLSPSDVRVARGKKYGCADLILAADQVQENRTHDGKHRTVEGLDDEDHAGGAPDIPEVLSFSDAPGALCTDTSMEALSGQGVDAPACREAVTSRLAELSSLHRSGTRPSSECRLAFDAVSCTVPAGRVSKRHLRLGPASHPAVVRCECPATEAGTDEPRDGELHACGTDSSIRLVSHRSHPKRQGSTGLVSEAQLGCAPIANDGSREPDCIEDSVAVNESVVSPALQATDEGDAGNTDVDVVIMSETELAESGSKTLLLESVACCALQLAVLSHHERRLGMPVILLGLNALTKRHSLCIAPHLRKVWL